MPRHAAPLCTPLRSRLAACAGVRRRPFQLNSACHPADRSVSAAPARAPESSRQSYSIELPEGWQGQSKAGADVLFEDPQRPSTNIGVTVAPVRVASIAQFGTPDAVADKLLAAERAKVRAMAA